MKCSICNEDFDDINSHIKSHNVSPYNYYENYVKCNHLCENCYQPIEYRHSLNKTLRNRFCCKSCQVSKRNKDNSESGINPFQKCNLIFVNGKSIRHQIGHKTAVESGNFNWCNNGTEERIKSLSEMHRITALHQIDNGNSIYSTQFHSSKEELYFGTKLNEWGIDSVPQYMDSRWTRRYKGDYYLPKYNIIIEIDGDFKFHEGKLDKKYLDRELQIFKESEIPIIHIKTSKVYSIGKDELMQLISCKVQRLSKDEI